MSVLLAATISLGQLCYNADQDINADDFIKGASIYHESLVQAVQNKESICLPITSKAQLEEAQKLESMDASGKTLILK